MERSAMNKLPMNIPERMETERLYLRAYAAGDGPMYYAASLRNRDHLTEFESGNVLMSLENEQHAETIVRQLAANWTTRNCFFIGVFEKGTDEWVGQVYVGPTNWELPEFTIGYVADVNHEGKGYISEAVRRVLEMLFQDMGAHRVTSDCHEDNARSVRLLERSGFRREGHLLENRRNADGSFHGDYLYALLRREYLSG
jgi:RimJ/RimL family protein N-acetyltransferase